MNQANQGDSSVFPLVHPLKRRRGRPRKDPSLKHARAARIPPGFDGKKEYLPQRVDRTDGIDSMVGQAVTGVIDATFDAGYLLTVRIGNSNTNLRGVVFKPGHYVPVTSETDIAPHIQMIRRTDVRLPAENQGWSRGQKLAIQTADMMPSKHKYASPVTVPSVPPVGVRGTVVPVVLQPVNLSNGLPISHQVSSDGSESPHVMAFGDKDVHMVEPLAMLPPDRSLPVSQIFVATQPQPHSNNQATQGIEHISVNEGTSGFGQEKASKPMKSADTDTPGSSQSADIQVENDSEAWKSSPEDSGVMSKQDTGIANEPFLPESTLQTSLVSKPLCNYGTGRMTELLKAVQENMKDNQVQIAEKRTFASEIEFHETRMAETDKKSEADVP